MIMLYTGAHNYILEQKREITAYVLENFWRPKLPLIHVQHHLVPYKGLST